MFLAFLFGAGLTAAAYYDLKMRNVPDLITSLLWVFMAMFGDNGAKGLAISVFSLLYLLNVYKYVCGWADILIVPLWVAFMASFFPNKWLIGILVFVGLNLILERLAKDKGLPQLPIMAASYWFVFCLSAI
jgi:hypothetical protein